ncbi:LPS export ABC transporter periplasmic protein LptC [bacterium]|nr:LPS export ABC transporter periplasmic protein LptC [bacterium]
MALKKILTDKKNLAYIILFSVITIACLWAFVSAGMLTKSFKNKLIDQTYKNKEANVESLLFTETKDGKKLWELYADTGTYSDLSNVVLLEDIIGNFYEENKVKASFKAKRGTYNTTKKEIILYEDILIVYTDGTNIRAEKIIYAGKEKDILAQGNVRIEKPDEAVIMGTKAILKGDFSDFNIEGRTQSQFYM